METKDSKALTEVWDWKERAYQKVKGLSLDEQIKRILTNAKPLADSIRRRKKGQAKV